jgi:hypothetical protein
MNYFFNFSIYNGLLFPEKTVILVLLHLFVQAQLYVLEYHSIKIFIIIQYVLKYCVLLTPVI